MKEKLLLFRRPSSSVIVSALGALALSIPAVRAADAVWTGATDGNYDELTNWSTGAVPGISGSGGLAGASTDVATFSSSANSPISYTSAGGSDVNLGGVAFTGTPGAIEFRSGSGSGTRRIYFTAGGAGVSMDASVASSMKFARVGISSGASGLVTFKNDATDSSAILNFSSTFLSQATGPSTLELTGSNSGDNIVANNISESAGALSVVKNGDGTWVLAGAASTYSGGFTINSGTLGLRSSKGFGSGVLTINGGKIASMVIDRTVANNISVGGDFTLGGLNQSIALNGTVDLGGATRTVTLGNSATLGGEISNGALTVAAGGFTLNLAAANNTYAGATLVSSGTLLINGALANSASVTADGGATVGGDGSIANALTLASGSALRPGASTGDAVVGSLDTGNLTLAGAYFATITANGVNDFLNITGNANFTGGTIAPFLSSYAPVLGDAFHLAEWTGSSTGVPTFDYNFAVLDPGLKWDDSSFVSDGFLRVAAVPEPSAALLGSLGCLLFFRRRKS